MIGTQEGGVSLYDHLQAQKLAKQEEFEEASKLRHQFRPLDNAEVEFLEGIKDKQRFVAESVRKDTAEQLEAFRKQREEALEQETKSEEAEIWTTNKKRRRVAADEGKQQSKLTKVPTASPRIDPPTAAKDTKTVIESEAKSVKLPTQVSGPASSLVAYNSDSD